MPVGMSKSLFEIIWARQLSINYSNNITQPAHNQQVFKILGASWILSL